MQYVIYASHLRNGFQNFPEAPQYRLPHLKHLIQLISSLEETKTWSGPETAAAIAGK